MNRFLMNSINPTAGWWRAIVLFLATTCTGCMSSGPIGCSNRPNVIVMRGTAGYFPHLSEFEDQLVEEGTCPTVAYPDAEATVAERIIGGRNRGRLNGPIIIVGYSAGANAAVSLAERLNVHGVEVDKLVLVEATDAKRIPSNVQACLNIYKSQPWTEYVPVLAGRPVQSVSPTTDVVNYDVRDYNDGRFDWENHLTLAANPYVRDLVLDEVVDALKPPEQEEPMESSTEAGHGSGGAGRAGDPTETIPPPSD